MRNLLTLTWLFSGRSRGGRGRLLGTTAGIALGTILFLLLCAGYQGITDRTARADLFYDVKGQLVTPPVDDTTDPTASGTEDATTPDLRPAVADGSRPAANEILTPVSYYGGATERFRGREINRVDIATSPDTTATIPGVAALPGPGEFVASPALTRLIDTTPPDQLGTRYGTQIGSIGTEALTGPDSLLVIVGHSPAELGPLPGMALTTGFTGVPYPSSVYLVLSLVGGIAVLIPVIILIGIVTRLGQAQRSERLATLAVIGAAPRRLALLSAVEMLGVSVAGAAVGIAAYFASIPLIARIRVEGTSFFPSDLVLGPGTVAAVSIGVVCATTLTAFVSAWRTRQSAAGASRTAPERPPRAWRLLPLLAGLLGLSGCLIVNRLALTEDTRGGIIDALSPYTNVTVIPTFVLIAFGIIVAGPYLLSLISRGSARRATRAESVLALNRLRRHPVATFRTVSGLVIALFVVTVFAVALTAEDSVPTADAEAIAAHGRSTEMTRIFASAAIADASGAESGDPAESQERARAGDRAEAQDRAEAAAKRIGAVPGTTASVVVSMLPTPAGDAADDTMTSGDSSSTGDSSVTGDTSMDGPGSDRRPILSADSARALGLDVPAGARAVFVESRYLDSPPYGSETTTTEAVPESALPTLVPTRLLVRAAEDPAAIERVRTAVLTEPALGTYGMFPVLTRAEHGVSSSPLGWAQAYANLATIGILVATLISAVSLAVSTSAGVIDRRRPLALLRLTGMPARRIRAMIALESTVPILATFLLCIGLGVFVAWAMIDVLSADRTIGWPSPGYYGMLVACLGLAALAVITTFGTARRAIAVTSTRFE